MINRRYALVIIVIMLIVIFCMQFVVNRPGKPKLVSELSYDENGIYTLALSDYENSQKTVIIGANEKNRAKQYIILNQKYEQILMTDTGMLLISGNDADYFKNIDGKLIQQKAISVPYNLITSELAVSNDGEMYVNKEIRSDKLSEQAQKQLQLNGEVISINKGYSMTYDEAFNINDENYIPRDFDELSLHQ